MARRERSACIRIATLPIFLAQLRATLRCMGPREKKVKSYSEVPQTPRQHLRKRRLDMNLIRKQVAARFAISSTLYHGWENDRPQSRQMVGGY